MAGWPLSLLTGARVLLSFFGRYSRHLACCTVLELESSARSGSAVRASCVPELVVGMCSRVSPRGPWHHRSPRGDLCVWPSTTSSWLQFVVRRSERVCGSSLCGIWPRVRRLMWLPRRRGARAEPRTWWYDAILKEIAILRCPDPKNFLASQGRTVTDHELASVTCRLHGLPSRKAK